jgi:hypothetical protein
MGLRQIRVDIARSRLVTMKLGQHPTELAVLPSTAQVLVEEGLRPRQSV